jgi:fluoride ion exporter CrcB/FEX
MSYPKVFLGASISGALRHGVNGGSLRLFGQGFAARMVVVNVLGSVQLSLRGNAPSLAAIRWGVK